MVYFIRDWVDFNAVATKTATTKPTFKYDIFKALFNAKINAVKDFPVFKDVGILSFIGKGRRFKSNR